MLFYIENKDLFSDIDSDLITHFSIEEWKSWDNSGLACDSIRRRLQTHIEELELDNLKTRDMLSFLFYSTIGDSTFDDWPYKNKDKIEKIFSNKKLDTIDKLILVRKIIINGEAEKKLNTIIGKINKIITNRKTHKHKTIKSKSLLSIVGRFNEKGEEKNNSYYKIENFTDIYSSFSALCAEIDNILSEQYIPYKLHHWHGLVNKLYYFRPVKIYNDKSKRHLEDLSHGEFVSVKLRHDIFKRMLQRDCAIILDDEPDRCLHAEWSRTFILSYINSIKKIRKFLAKHEKEKNFESKKINILITTHSPIILSDFYNEEVLFLEKENGKVSQADGLNNCFAGNIAEILLDNFCKKNNWCIFRRSYH